MKRTIEKMLRMVAEQKDDIRHAWANLDGPIPACWHYSISTYSGATAPDQTSLNGYTTNTC
jgi:hypothetical protein